VNISPVGEDFFHADRDRQIDTMKLTVAFRSFAKAPKMISVSYK